MEGYSPNNPSVKRILREMKEMEKDTSHEYSARALEDNIFEWHFTVRGPSGTPFEGGVYHGRILLPAEYPFKPPNIVWLTPNGRFDVGTKICLTISAHHPEHWQPSWSTLVALIGFLPTPGEGALGALDYSADERRALARKSVHFCCPKCGPIANILPPVSSSSSTSGNEEGEAPATPPVERRAEELGERQQQQQPEAQPWGGAPERAAEQQPQPHQVHGPPQQEQQQQEQQDHEIEGPAKLLNYIIIALFFAIVAVVMRKLTN
ncbi:Ubiquitinconjugating enzyme subfamily protein [Acanthamoeba castellanii str. Neff]|uniref:Ubiquitinconjugating enzyme subfamily protein n=1 Tax=Acanthamoeba castellanii (strain ATCC 30010 / Neff) TaxID=1257118 RepID=L8GPT2_ACACF|nr:Ubiquitinconjugating enzyme subfamily protein [Acanthamoeba castellanii str. Neff]ELR15179.1 Ubiquitinconjugating enzyme subfamily protein [Acanthamoeba castellanii str. Neff]